MPVTVSMHACSVWPVNLDLTVFRFFLEGYSVEETVEQLMALQASPQSKASTGTTAAGTGVTAAGAARATAPHSSSGSASTATTTQSSSHAAAQLVAGDDAAGCQAGARARISYEGEQLTEDHRARLDAAEEITLAAACTPTSANSASLTRSMPVITTVNTSTNAAHPHQDRSKQHRHHHHRHSQEKSALLPPPAPAPSSRSHTRESSAHRKGEKSHHHSTARASITSSSRPRTAATSATNTATASFAMPPLQSSYEYAGLRRAPSRSGDATSIEDITRAAAGLEGRHASQRLASGNAAEAKAAAAMQRRSDRQRRRKERQSFFLNEDYIKFQRQLQEVEAIGGVGKGASSLQSRYLFEEVTEQFQGFRELAKEEQLGSPYAFLSNYYMPIPVATRLTVLEMYYETDGGVFRWAFGDRLSRFDLPGALTALREAVIGGGAVGDRGNLRILFSKSLQEASNASMTNGNASMVSAGGSWYERWRSSPGKLATMDAVTLLRLTEQNMDSLRRQWENVKRVCVTSAALYRGKGGLCVPLDMSLHTTIQQCFGLRHQQALDYATAAFGYEHRLETRLFERLHDFNEYGSICSIVASLWCDDSDFFLSDPFRAGCRRVGKLLDEYRILSELHQLVFGEAMRPRWQVQLDEVQRVITTSSLVEKNSVAAATAGSPVGGGNVSHAGLPINGPSPSGLPSYSRDSRVNNGSLRNTSIGGPLATSPSGVSLGSTIGSLGSPAAAGAASPTEASGISPTIIANNNSGNVHSPLSGNGAYSRRFLLEFPSLMKQLLRIAVTLDHSGDINEALDIYFTRIYVVLELLSTRTAPAIVSMVMNATAPAGMSALAGSPVTGVANVSGSFAGAAPGRPPLPPTGDRFRSRSHNDLRGAGDSDASLVGPRSPPPAGAAVEGAVARGANGGESAMSAPNFAGVPSQGTDGRGFGIAAGEETPGTSSLGYAGAAVVNTSLFHPGSTLFPFAAIAAHNSSASLGSFGGSSPLLGGTNSGHNFPGEEELPEWPGVRGAATTPLPPPASAVLATSVGTGMSFSAGSSDFATQVGEMVRKAVDKRFLRELCMLLTALPKLWPQLTALSAEDHQSTDKTMSDLAMALKAITQVLMATDDFS